MPNGSRGDLPGAPLLPPSGSDNTILNDWMFETRTKVIDDLLDISQNIIYASITSSYDVPVSYKVFLDPAGAIIDNYNLMGSAFVIQPNVRYSFGFPLNKAEILSERISNISLSAYRLSDDGEMIQEKNDNVLININNIPGGAIPFWENDYPVTSDRTNIFQFRQDNRNAVLDAIQSEVRDLFFQNIGILFNFTDSENGVDDWNPIAFSSAERTRFVDDMIRELMYNIEKTLNIFGDTYVQSLYTDIYANIEGLRNNLNELIDDTVSATINNLDRSREILETLQQKVNQQTLMQYNVSLVSVPKNQISAWLYKTNSTNYWNINDKLFELNNQLVLDFSNLDDIVGTNKSNYFQSWYIKIHPKLTTISNYTATQDRLLITDIDEEDVNIINGTLYDVNGRSYKIINKIMITEGIYGWLLSESINRNTIDSPLTFMFNYFEPQTIELKFNWKHNYIPKSLPLGIQLPGLARPDFVVEEIETEVGEETVELGVEPEINKDVF